MNELLLLLAITSSPPICDANHWSAACESKVNAIEEPKVAITFAPRDGVTRISPSPEFRIEKLEREVRRLKRSVKKISRRR